MNKKITFSDNRVNRPFNWKYVRRRRLQTVTVPASRLVERLPQHSMKRLATAIELVEATKPTVGDAFAASDLQNP